MNKSGGDIVIVMRYVLSSKERITEKEILEMLKEAAILKVFQELPEGGRNKMPRNITAQNPKKNKS